MKYRTVDKLAEIQAAIEVLAIQAEKLKTQLKERGEGRYEGSEFVATVSEFDRTGLNAERVKRYLTPAQLWRVTTKTPVTSVTVRPIES